MDLFRVQIEKVLELVKSGQSKLLNERLVTLGFRKGYDASREGQIAL